MMDWTVVWYSINGGVMGMGVGAFFGVVWLQRRVIRIEIMLGIGKR